MQPNAEEPAGESRRSFLKKTTGATMALAASQMVTLAGGLTNNAAGPGKLPWYRTTHRWGQTNLTEIDPTRYDIGWWRKYWKHVEVQGIVVNAGGIVAFYPSKIPYQYRPPSLGDRDLYGEVTRAAHEDGLVVLARMDASHSTEECVRDHPDWFSIDVAGKQRNDPCVNGPYFREYLPSIMREIIERSHPEGITWNRVRPQGAPEKSRMRADICYCENCRHKFFEKTGKDLPAGANWNDPVFRAWIQWSYAVRTDLWDFNNSVTKAAGGPDCLWIGMSSAPLLDRCKKFEDTREICRRADMLMVDHQERNAGGFQYNGTYGKVFHTMLGWDKLVVEGMAMYQSLGPADPSPGKTRPDAVNFRLASKPAPEARMWMLEGMAAGLQPKWTHIDAYQEDRRMYHTAGPVCRWHKTNEEFLLNREPVANIGLVWSQRNADFFGRDNGDDLVETPARGMDQVLIRARIPYLPLSVDYIERDAGQFSVLILTNLGAMSDSEVAVVRAFVERGGSLIATGDTSLFNEWGDPRPDFALNDLFAAHLVKPARLADDADRLKRAGTSVQSYLRISPELRARVDGPEVGTEPPITAERHPVLRGFEETDILPFGGILDELTIDPQAIVPLTFIPAIPTTPPEEVWMRVPKTNIPGLVLNTRPNGARIAFVPADLDRRFNFYNMPDHGDLLANLVRWAAKDDLPLAIEGPGLIDCHLYRQPGRFILQLINLTSAATWRAPVHEYIPVGPLIVRVKLPDGARTAHAQFKVANAHAAATIKDGWATIKVPSILDHEMIVIQV